MVTEKNTDRNITFKGEIFSLWGHWLSQHIYTYMLYQYIYLYLWEPTER